MNQFENLKCFQQRIRSIFIYTILFFSWIWRTDYKIVVNFRQLFAKFMHYSNYRPLQYFLTYIKIGTIFWVPCIVAIIWFLKQKICVLYRDRKISGHRDGKKSETGVILIFEPRIHSKNTQNIQYLLLHRCIFWRQKKTTEI